MTTDSRPQQCAIVMRPMMLSDLLPAAASTTFVTLLGFLVLTVI